MGVQVYHGEKFRGWFDYHIPDGARFIDIKVMSEDVWTANGDRSVVAHRTLNIPVVPMRFSVSEFALNTSRMSAEDYLARHNVDPRAERYRDVEQNAIVYRWLALRPDIATLEEMFLLDGFTPADID